MDYVKSSLNWDKVPDDWMRKIKAIQVPDPKMHPANNWCGYFVTWAMQQSGVAGLKWEFGTGLKKTFKKLRTDFANMKPGDAALFSLRSHHALVASVSGKDVITLDGNASYGEVNLHKRKLGSGQQRIVAFYSLDDLPASAVSNVRAPAAATSGAEAEAPDRAEERTPAPAQSPAGPRPAVRPVRRPPLVLGNARFVAYTGAQLRQQPRRNARLLARLTRCQRATVLGRAKGEWTKVRVGRRVGYLLTANLARSVRNCPSAAARPR